MTPSTGQIQPAYARALVIEDADGSRVGFVSVDVIGMVGPFIHIGIQAHPYTQRNFSALFAPVFDLFQVFCASFLISPYSDPHDSLLYETGWQSKSHRVY